MDSSPLAKAGVMGWPVGHSLSPRLHAYWLKQYGLQGSYEALPVQPQELRDALRALPDKGFRGVNLTVPHKEAACVLVDRLSATARRIGAVNLVTVGDDGKLRGDNTDAYGFMQNLVKSGFKPSGGAAFILGARGAARAVTVALTDMGYSDIRVASRTMERAEKLAVDLSTPECVVSTVPWSETPKRLDGVELLVNATTLGMTGQQPLIFPFDTLPVKAYVADVVYAPLETEFLRRAGAMRHLTIDGLGMLLHQARPSFAAFFGRDPEVTMELRRFVLKEKT